MELLLPFYCLFAHMAIMSHLGLLYYKVSGSSESKKLVSTMNEEQKKLYGEIKKERMHNYKVGVVIGMLLSFLYIKNIKTDIKPHLICVYVGITTLIANAYYIFKPKSLWMIEHLDTLEQVKLHNDVYKKMKNITDYSNLLGFVIFAFGRLL